MGVPNEHRRIEAFSLLELLVVCAIIGVIGSAIAVTLAVGLRVWERAQALGGAQTTTLVGLEIMGRDLQNTFPLYAVGMEGTSESVTFPGLVSQSDSTGRRASRIGTIKCYHDRGRQALVKKNWVFPCPEPPDAAGEVILPEVTEVILTYLAGGSGRREPQWQTSWHSRTNLPLAVKMTVRRRPEKGQSATQKTFFLHNS